MNLIKNFIACIKLGMWIGRNDNTDKRIDMLLNYVMKNNLKPLSISRFDIVFENCTLWNANKYYGWLSRGSSTINGCNFTWESGMASPYMMLKFKIYLDNIMANSLAK